MSGNVNSGSLISNIGLERLIEIVDQIYDGVELWDGEYNLLYTNRASLRLYGAGPEEMMGRNLSELMGYEKFWSPSTLPYVYKNKAPILQRQKTFMGHEIDVIAVPILGAGSEVEYVVMTARETYGELLSKLSPVHKPESSYNEDTSLIFRSRIMEELVGQAARVARTDANCVIMGETGTGKNELAKLIHSRSNRSKQKLLTINMACMSTTLIESELFGYVKGAFTGSAAGGKKGLLEYADGGTIFMDEIGELPIDFQAKLLQFLQEGEFIPVGGVQPVKVNVRVIAATNKNLAEMVRMGAFREDLYHRLNVIELEMPSLRRREGDVELLTSHFLEQFNRKYDRQCSFSEEAMEKLRTYKWPGNVRELANVIERCVIMAENEIIQPYDLPGHIFTLDYSPARPACGQITDLTRAVEEYEGRIVRASYEVNDSTRKLAAALNLSQTTARRLIDKYVKTE